MEARPPHHRIFVRRLDEGEQHVDGIIIPDSPRGTCLIMREDDVVAVMDRT